jgi:UDP-N-acetylmuramate dehydrogenase
MNVMATKYIPLYSDNDLISLAEKPGIIKNIKLVLGGGSNLLLTKNIQGTVLHMLAKGISVVHETKENVFVQASAGENWDSFVQYAVQNGWGGIENLSLIPGTVGASPIQNIGAYGAEVKDTIESVRYFNLKTKTFCILKNKDCRFGYRDSIFKHKLKNTAIITHVVFRLSKKPVLNSSYGAVAEELKKYPAVNLLTLREAVIAIRRRKLPDPTIMPNSGSFFKNPVVTSAQYKKIQKAFPDIPHFISEDKKIKIPAAWMIEQCGWKGFRKGDAGVHELQPLVLVNYGKATGKEILALASKIIQSVKKKFGVDLATEVNVI